MDRIEEGIVREGQITKLEVFGEAVAEVAQGFTEWIEVLAEEGVTQQDLDMLTRISDVSARVIGPIDDLFNAINEVPTRITVFEEPEDIADNPIEGDKVDAQELPSLLQNLNQREHLMWDLVKEGGSDTEWFAQTDLDLSSIGFASNGAKNTAFSHLVKKCLEAGLLVSNGKERGARRYMINPSVSSKIIELAQLQSEEIDTQAPEDDPESDEQLEIDVPDFKAGGKYKEEVTIRGESYHFTPNERKIIDCLLEGPKGMRDIINNLYGGDNGYEDREFFQNEFLPAFRHLETLVIDGAKIIQDSTVDNNGRKFKLFVLPEGARFEFNKRRGTWTFRFTDLSTYIGSHSSKDFEPTDEDLTLDDTAPDPILDVPTATEVLVAAKPLHKPIPRPKPILKPAILEGSKLIKPSGGEVELEFPRRKILHILSSGDRLTVAEITKLVADGEDGVEVDRTLNDVIAGELAQLQLLIGKDSLKRKQKNTQLARWWLEPDSLIVETNTSVPQ